MAYIVVIARVMM